VVSLTEIVREQLCKLTWSRGYSGVSCSITRIVEVVESDVVVKRGRRNTIAAWLVQQQARRRIGGEQVHSGDGGERGVEKRGAGKRELSDIVLDVRRQLVSRKQRVVC
jgi:hypothetical protein